MKKALYLLALAAITAAGAIVAGLFYNSGVGELYPIYIEDDPIVCYKPVIYLYPQQQTQVRAELLVDGELLFTYPEYNDGWCVTAQPDGTLTDDSGSEYSYLFWEAESNVEWDFSEGFCVKGSDTVEFLRWALAQQGLLPKEYNEFIVYWAPRMQENEYNVISFQTDLYEGYAKLDVKPAPDSVKRVFMAYYASDSRVEIPAQELCGFERSGFTVVEWGGTFVN